MINPDEPNTINTPDQPTRGFIVTEDMWEIHGWAGTSYSNIGHNSDQWRYQLKLSHRRQSRMMRKAERRLRRKQKGHP